jgi:hypothetical protein
MQRKSHSLASQHVGFFRPLENRKPKNKNTRATHAKIPGKNET